MGWNSCFVLAHKKSLKTLENSICDVYAVTKEIVDWETATSSSLHPHMALGTLDGWAVAWSPSVKAATWPETLERLSSRGRALAGIVFSHSNYYGFHYYASGKLQRRLLRENRRLVDEMGDPLPAEADLDWRDEERAVFQLAKMLTGLDPTDIDLWGDVRFKVARV